MVQKTPQLTQAIAIALSCIQMLKASPYCWNNMYFRFRTHRPLGISSIFKHIVLLLYPDAHYQYKYKGAWFSLIYVTINLFTSLFNKKIALDTKMITFNIIIDIRDQARCFWFNRFTFIQFIICTKHLLNILVLWVGYRTQ